MIRPGHLLLPAAGLATAALLLAARAETKPPCDPQNAGLTLPQGFCAGVFADSVVSARHMAVAPNGDVLVAMSNKRNGPPGGVLILRDADRDGRADTRQKFGATGGTGIALRGTHLYVALDDAVLRYNLPPGSMTPQGGPDTIVKGLPASPGHSAKTIVLGRGNELFVNIGSATNSCQVKDRTAGSPGVDPCTELETRAGVWLFDATRTGQTQATGSRYATGLRNMVALTLATDGVLYGVQHGRDQLSQNWPGRFDDEYNAENPAEIFVRIERGDDYGWPYCYFATTLSAELQQQVLSPEYGGDGKKVGRCADKKMPLLAFPAHWAPNGVAFYTGSQFPARFRDGVFVAFHGSWNRSPLPQAGFNVAFVPFANGRPSGPYEVFADGFAGPGKASGRAAHRPTGVALMPDGSVLISDDTGGRIYRISYTAN